MPETDAALAQATDGVTATLLAWTVDAAATVAPERATQLLAAARANRDLAEYRKNRGRERCERCEAGADNGDIPRG
jgi:hypothetical protein